MMVEVGTAQTCRKEENARWGKTRKCPPPPPSLPPSSRSSLLLPQSQRVGAGCQVCQCGSIFADCPVLGHFVISLHNVAAFSPV